MLNTLEKSHKEFFMKFSTLAIAFILTTASPLALAGHEWGYHFPMGPAQWGGLEGYSACSTGSTQSPVAIETGVNADIQNVKLSSELPSLNPDLGDVSSRAVFNGHTVQAPLTGTKFSFGGQEYSAAQYHFHSPSEHALNERQYPLEAHFVHQSASGKLLVMGVFFEEGAVNPALEETFKSMNEGELRISIADLFPRDLSYVTYQGSLTTPPCSEGVTWIVLKTPVEASRQQLGLLQKITGGPNNRPIQSQNGRDLLTDSL